MVGGWIPISAAVLIYIYYFLFTERPVKLEDKVQLALMKRDTKSYVRPNKNTTIRSPRNVCPKSKTLLLLVVVHSTVTNFHKREEVRKYWDYSDNGTSYNTTTSNSTSKYGTKLDDKVKIIFLLGMPSEGNLTSIKKGLDKEAEKYGDILQENFIDSYYNLSLKSAMMLKWVLSNCANNVRYIIKTDDDVALMARSAVKYLEIKATTFDDSILKSQNRSLRKEEYLLLGRVYCDGKVIRQKNHKYYCPPYVYSKARYPCYTSGRVYLYTVPTARALYAAVNKTPYFHLEDVFITGICRDKAKPKIEAQYDEIIDYIGIEISDDYMSLTHNN